MLNGNDGKFKKEKIVSTGFEHVANQKKIMKSDAGKHDQCKSAPKYGCWNFICACNESSRLMGLFGRILTVRLFSIVAKQQKKIEKIENFKNL